MSPESRRAKYLRQKGYKPDRLALSLYKSNARRRGLAWALEDEHALDLLITDHCFYCGAPPTNGIDRVNNLKGYVEDNVVSCCRMCNNAKLDSTRGAV